ncbi:MAG: exo-alpha-sialidase [candidate division KSB1 bacterium]|nr:exo-alpha-sialidase [candidate division KSB1 bacterium]
MNQLKKNFILFLLVIILSVMNLGCQNQTDRFHPGLVGAHFGNPDLTGIKDFSLLENLNQSWGEANGFSMEWSGIWEGLVTAPISGEVTFHLSTNKHAFLKVGNAMPIEVSGEANEGRLLLMMCKGERYPIELRYRHEVDGEGFFSVQWSWNGMPKSQIAPQYLFHTSEQASHWNWLIEPDPKTIDRSQFITISAKHVIVCHEPGLFFGWPANNGVWQWGDEILVGLVKAHYKMDRLHHSRDKSRPSYYLLARSLDGGESWSLEDPENFAGDGGKPMSVKDKIHFSHPDFAMRCWANEFFVSYDRGKTWQGPFSFPDFGLKELTSRTDYLVISEESCLFFLSAKVENVRASLQDRAFCARTSDGGRTFQFLSWMTETDTVRSVMPSTVRLADNHLVSALRRRYDPTPMQGYALQKNWIDVYQSLDNGASWQFLSKVADTDNGKRNGNPPSMVRLKDGRLCVTYGYRGIPYSIRARISADEGKTWGKEIILREDAPTNDIGYTRSVVRSDGKVVTIYYFTTEQNVEQHIAATIWDPAGINP